MIEAEDRNRCGTALESVNTGLSFGHRDVLQQVRARHILLKHKDIATPFSQLQVGHAESFRPLGVEIMIS